MMVFNTPNGGTVEARTLTGGLSMDLHYRDKHGRTVATVVKPAHEARSLLVNLINR